jgi:hypothetical protein
VSEFKLPPGEKSRLATNKVFRFMNAHQSLPRRSSVERATFCCALTAVRRLQQQRPTPSEPTERRAPGLQLLYPSNSCFLLRNICMTFGGREFYFIILLSACIRLVTVTLPQGDKLKKNTLTIGTHKFFCVLVYWAGDQVNYWTDFSRF